MNEDQIAACGDELYEALRARSVVSPLTSRWPDVSLDEAYRISRAMLARRAADGERVVGKKIGVTGYAIQEMLGVSQPDYGFLTDAMWLEGPEVPLAQMSQPRAEAELAFILGERLQGPGVSAQDVLAATESVALCFEIVDSRIADWKIRIQDTVADNASAGVFVLGQARLGAHDMDWSQCLARVSFNGELSSETRGDASTPGSPQACVAWLANVLGERGVALEPGEVILSGALGPLVWVKPGDVMEAHIQGLDTLSVRFV